MLQIEQISLDNDGPVEVLEKLQLFRAGGQAELALLDVRSFDLGEKDLERRREFFRNEASLDQLVAVQRPLNAVRAACAWALLAASVPSGPKY
ncbi:MAG: hypothetical protein CML06_08400, partial [Pseudomonadales bacterium]|nr:hypothetical protein [Pseudomonadales bacterium]